MTSTARTTAGSLRGQVNGGSSILDREMAILLVAYPDRMRRAEAEDLWALFDFLLDGME